MRRYSSFVIRRWQLPSTQERVEVEHMQTGQRAVLSSLAEATAWIERVGAQGRSEETLDAFKRSGQ